MSDSCPITEPAPPPDQSRWFAEKVQPHDAALRAYMRSSFSSLRDLDDVVQESYLRIWKRQAARPITSIRSFLYTVARNLALDRLRRQRSSPMLDVTEFVRLSVIEDKPGADEVTAANQEYALVLEAIDALPARCRAVVVRRKLRGLSPGETARELGISEETVHVQARRGLRRLQEHLLRQGVIRSQTA